MNATLRFPPIIRWFLLFAGVFLTAVFAGLSLDRGFNVEYLAMAPIVVAALAMFVHQSRRITIDDAGVSSIDLFGRRHELRWHDIDRAQLKSSGLLLTDGRDHGGIHIPRGVIGFQMLVELVASNPASLPSVLATTYGSTRHLRVIWGLSSIFLVTAIIAALNASPEDTRAILVIASFGVFGVGSTLVSPIRLRIEDDAVLLIAPLRIRRIMRDDVVDVQWQTQVGRYGAQLTYAALLLKNNRIVKLGQFEPQIELYTALQLWLTQVASSPTVVQDAQHART